jgi:beta-phosphoglucomutase
VSRESGAIQAAILCDLDGTLVDTDYANYLAYRLAVFEVTRGKIQLIYDEKRVTRRRLNKLMPTLTDAQLKEIALLKMNYFTQFLSVTRLNTMLASLIAEHSLKNDIVLLTYCRERRATAILEYYKLLKYFNKLICREVLSRNAAPNKYETAIRITGMHRESIIVFDNDHSGVAAAVDAGIPGANIYKIISERENVYD